MNRLVPAILVLITVVLFPAPVARLAAAESLFLPILIGGRGVAPSLTPTETVEPTWTATPEVTEVPILTELRGASQDTYINKLDESKNYENKSMVVRGAGEKRLLLNFDIGGIPAGSEVVSATLRLTATNYDDGKTHLGLNVGAYLLNRMWLADQATWLRATNDSTWAVSGANGVPGDRAASPESVTLVKEISGTTSATMVRYDWNVKSIVQSWVMDSANHSGLLLIADDGNYRELSFFDSAYLVTEYRPLLEILWLPGATVQTPTPTGTQTPGMTHTPTLGDTRTPTHTPKPPTNTPRPPTATPTQSGGPCSCSGNLYNCDNFDTQAEAQACFDYCMQVTGRDIHGLDSDGDGEACENLPLPMLISAT